MLASTLKKLASLELLTKENIFDEKIEHFYCGDLLSLVLKHARKPHTCLLTTNTSMNVLGVSVLMDYPVVIFTSGEYPNHEVINKANEEHITLFATNLDALELYQEILNHESEV